MFTLKTKEINSNEVFSGFIIESLPAGIKGLIVAAIFSAAMSSLSSSINALASSTMSDWVKRLAPSQYTLANSRLLSFVWTIVLAGGALLFTSAEGPLVEIGLAIASFTYGGLLGFFLLGRIDTQMSASAVMIGFFSSIVVMAAVVRLTTVAWPWYTLVGLTIMVVVSCGVRWFQK